MCARAHACARAVMCARSARRAMTAASTGPRLARHRLSSRNPTLPPNRFNSQLSHVSVQAPKQGKCLMCRYKYLCKKIEHPEEEREWGVIGRPRRKCLGCDVYLCIAYLSTTTSMRFALGNCSASSSGSKEKYFTENMSE